MVTDDGRVVPLVLLDRAGVLVDAALTNSKGLRKSLEQGALWVLHSTTGKLLPYARPEGATTPRLASLVERGDFAVATLEMIAAGTASPEPDEGAVAGSVSETGSGGTSVAGASQSGGAAELQPQPQAGGIGRTEAPAASSAPGTGPASPPAARTADVITHLIDVIRDRKETMPEGSYTSYLFREGSSKIRKKTGEEAVEVVLSQSREELARESADLIYHLLVLLAAENVSWEGVLEVLEERGR